MKIVILFPTRTEAQYFSHPECVVEISGVGHIAMAHHTTQAIARHKPDWIILAGIAGVYPRAPFQVGDSLLVCSETEADLGFFTPTGFVHLADHAIAMDFSVNRALACPHIPHQPLFPVARSNSLSAAMAPFVSVDQIDIENMEGAAFFHVCLAEQQAFLELRTISNVVDEQDTSPWDMDGSVRILGQQLHRLVDWLRTNSHGDAQKV